MLSWYSLYNKFMSRLGQELRDVFKSGDRTRLDKLRLDTVDPMYLADKRILIGPIPNVMVVDHSRVKMKPGTFSLMQLMAANVDQEYPLSEMVADVYGFRELSSQAEEPLTRCIYNTISAIRDRLGEELGDPKYGAIRTVVGVGYVAVSEL